jgi:hypothetical protein
VLKILRDAPAHLSEDGLLICEVGESEQRWSLLPEVPFAWIEFKVGQMGIFAVEAASCAPPRPHRRAGGIAPVTAWARTVSASC